MALNTVVERSAFLRLLPPPTGDIDTRNERGLFLRLFPASETISGTGSPVASYLAAFRALYLNSATFLVWINTVDGAGVTAGRVFLGWVPADLPDIVSGGPIVLLRWQDYRGDLAGSKRTFTAGITIVADHIWSLENAARAFDTFVAEAEFLDRIINEMITKIGITLDSTFGGHLTGWEAPDAVQQDPLHEFIAHSEVFYRIGFGRDG